MARLNNEHDFNFRLPAAAAGAVVGYAPVNQTFLFTDYSWFYESTEANADNALDWAIDYTTDGTNFTAILSNANAAGLLNTAAPLVLVTNSGNAASAGAAAVAATPTVVRVPAGAVMRATITTSGTGTIPAVQFSVTGQKV